MVYIFQHAILERAADSNVVKDGKVLDILAKAHSTCVRANGYAKLGRHKQHGEHLVDSSQTAAIYLAEIDRTSLQQLLKHHPAVTVFTSGNTDRGNRTSDGCMAQHIVGRSGLFDPMGTKN